MSHPTYGPAANSSNRDEEGGGRTISGIEMRENVRPHPPFHGHSDKGQMYSTASSEFPSQINTTEANIETESFLHGHPANKDTFTGTVVPLKDHSGKQFRHILTKSSVRWLITAFLCGSYILITIHYEKTHPLDEGDKRIYNSVTTGISIAMGLNFASASKDMALNLRWPILSARRRSLEEVDLLLKADSMTKLAQLAWVSRRLLIVSVCMFWLLINTAAQVAIAAVALTYGFDTYNDAVIMTPQANVSTTDMGHFYPQGNFSTVIRNPTASDELYTAHQYGQYAYVWGVEGGSESPKPNDIFNGGLSMIWTDYENNGAEFFFIDQGTKTLGDASSPQIYTSRTLTVNYTCDSYTVTSSTAGSLEVETIGNVTLSQMAPPNSITFFTNRNNDCGSPRCSVVEAFESNDNSTGWYYQCNITLGQTENDPQNVSFISDNMAHIATSSIAQGGYIDSSGQALESYPQDSPFGSPLDGDEDQMGQSMAVFALGTIAGAAFYGPSITYTGDSPSLGFIFHVNHHCFFYGIIAAILGCHLACIILVAFVTNEVMVGPEGHLGMSMLLRPIADMLEGVSGGKENAAFRSAVKHTEVKYEKSRSGRWILSMAHDK